MSNIIVWYKYPEKTKINSDDNNQVDIYLNGVLRVVVYFNGTLSKETQLITTDLFGLSGYVHSSSGGFSLFLKDHELDEFVHFWCPFKKGRLYIISDRFNQNYSINFNNPYDFYRANNSESNSQYKNWGLLRCLMESNQTNWGIS